MSLTRLNTFKFVPLYTLINSELSALVFEDANLNVLVDPVGTIAKYTVFSSKFSGKSPSSLITITFSPVDSLCADASDVVNRLSDGYPTSIVLTLDNEGVAVPSSIKIFADFSTPAISTNKTSLALAPTRKP